MSSYQIVVTKPGAPIQDLQAPVQAMLNQGWDLLDGPKQFVIDGAPDNRNHYFAQAMTQASWMTPPLS